MPKPSAWTLGSTLQLVALSFILGLVVFAHWAYHGCELSRNNSTFSVLKDLTSQQCPRIGLIPQTPLQRLILDWFPFANDAAEASYNIGCGHSFFNGPPVMCESIYAFSFLATIAEWCLYVILAGKMIHRVIIRPLASGVWRLIVILTLTFIATRAIHQYGHAVLPKAYADSVVETALTLENLILETFLFLYSSVMYLYYHIKQLGQIDSYPGESLFKTIKQLVLQLRSTS